MKDYIRLTGTLVIIAVIAALLLAGTNAITKPIIDENDRIATEAAIKQVLPNGEEFKPVGAEIVTGLGMTEVLTATEGIAGGQTVGYAIKVSTKAYGGDFEAIVGVNEQGVVTGIKIGNNSETAGFGKKAELPEFYEQYAGKTADITLAKGNATDNQINQITGATITSKAVTLGVNKAIEATKALFAQ